VGLGAFEGFHAVPPGGLQRFNMERMTTLGLIAGKPSLFAR
jgi:hypothetical protein